MVQILIFLQIRLFHAICVGFNGALRTPILVSLVFKSCIGTYAIRLPFPVKGKPSCMGDIVIMFDKWIYNSWDKLPISLKSNKPITEKEGANAEAIVQSI